MDFGIAVATSTNSWKAVKRAEELGFSHAWFYDTQLLNPDVFIGMTQAAMVTEKIRLGTGVLIPSNRIEPVAANAFATLNKIAPGRIDFGVGTGFTGRRTMGLGPITLSRMEEYVRRVQALLRGETVTWDFEGVERKIRFLNPDFGLINLDDDIPLHVSAMGPKARRLAAKLDAGWLNFSGNVEAAVTDLSDMQAAWRESGREGSPYSTLFILGCVLAPGESITSPRSLAQVGPWISVFFHNLVETVASPLSLGGLSPAVSDALARYREIHAAYEPADARYLTNHRGHLMFQRPEEAELMTEEVVSQLAGFTATREALRERIGMLADAGYSQVTVQLVEHHEDALEDWASVFDGL